MARQPRTYRKLDDVGAFRALAHPVRQRLIEDVLSTERPLTATEAAAQCNITPSAMSYHLRALEKYGMVERVDSVDGRTRPWRKTADGFDISGTDGSLPAAEAQTLLQRFVKSATSNIGSDDSLTMYRSTIALTERANDELNAQISQLLQNFRDRDMLDDEATERRRIVWINAPGEQSSGP
ncbi:helix-turn-helix domain-containing protein [Dermatophilaceae bacterium Sec6.4]